jgi:hypothetical protein
VKKAFLLTLATCLVLSMGWLVFEPGVLGAVTTSGNAIVTLSVTEEVSLTVPSSNLTMTALTMAVNTSANDAAGATWTVKTNSQDGWRLTLKTNRTNTLHDATTSEAFTDYTAAATTTPETWSVSNAYEFGFSVNGAKTQTGTWGTGTNCSSGTNVKYRGFASTTEITVATSSSLTSTSGVGTNLCVRAEQNGVYAPDGVYTSTITGTLTSTP